MSQSALVGLLMLVGALPCLAADEDKWVTVKGKFVWDAAKGPAPKRTPITADKDPAVSQGQRLPYGKVGSERQDGGN